MKIRLPNKSGELAEYSLTGEPILGTPLAKDSTRVVYSAAHVVADPFSDSAPMGLPGIDWDKTMAFRHHLAGHGLGIAEAMDTAQRGMGLDWSQSLDLIRRTKADLPDALVANGCGTDHLADTEVHSLEDAEKKYAISSAAVSGASEPCTEFSPTLCANSARIVPAAASDGFVAPITSRFFAIAPSPSRT